MKRFDVFDSSLSEEGVLGFEWLYRRCPERLVLWEAQFGDFGNGAQTIIDQYIAASEDKGNKLHDSSCCCRMATKDRTRAFECTLGALFQLCAENNLQVCYPTTPAQYFHLLRRQVQSGMERPLIVMTPKSLLRLPGSFFG